MCAIIMPASKSVMLNAWAQFHPSAPYLWRSYNKTSTTRSMGEPLPSTLRAAYTSSATCEATSSSDCPHGHAPQLQKAGKPVTWTTAWKKQMPSSRVFQAPGWRLGDASKASSVITA